MGCCQEHVGIAGTGVATWHEELTRRKERITTTRYYERGEYYQFLEIHCGVIGSKIWRH